MMFSTSVADKITYCPQWTWPKSYRLWSFRTNLILSVTHIILYILIEDKINKKNKPLNHPSPRYTQRSGDISFGSNVHSLDAQLVITSYWLQYEWSSKHINTWPGNAYLRPSLGICCIFFPQHWQLPCNWNTAKEWTGRPKKKTYSTVHVFQPNGP